MTVCLICEGSYPYVAGGVSSWVQMLIKEYEDIDFVIWSIATTREEMHEYKYSLPGNVKEVRTLYLGDCVFEEKRGKIRPSKENKEVLRMLIKNDADKTDFNRIFEFIKQYKNHLVELLMSRDFYEVCVEYYKERYDRTVFSRFLWTMRSMYFPLMAALSGELAKADIFHAVSTGYAGVLGSFASYIQDRPFLLTEHGIYTREREEEIIKSGWVEDSFKEMWIRFFRSLSELAYIRAERVFTLFEDNRKLQIELNCPQEKLTVIPNGVDYESLRGIAEEKKESPYYTIGAVVRVVPIKDIKTMLYAFDRVKERAPHARLLIMGPYEEDMEYYEECLALGEALKLQDVTFTGRVNIKEYLPLLDVMLLTSVSEGQPLAVLEGMAAGIPQVCTNVGNCKGLLLGENESPALGEAGMLAPIMDAEAIAAALVYLERNKAIRERMGAVGCERVKKYYRKQYFLETYYNIYYEIYGEKKGIKWLE